MNFIEKLLSASRKNKSLLCVGLDPDPDLMPPVDLAEFNRAIIDSTSDLVCAYKPNFAHFEAFGVEGVSALQATREHIPANIPVILDAKLGDIGNTGRAYSKAVFDVFGFDAVTVNPYLGYDSIKPFLDYADKGVLILCRTSNASAADFQNIPCSSGGSAGGSATLRPLFELVALKAKEWNVHGNIGLVVGATYPDELKTIREICPDMPLLIPGIGAQGGDIRSSVEYGTDKKGEKAIISSSRQILYASKGRDYAAMARQAALKLRDEINLNRSLATI